MEMNFNQHISGQFNADLEAIRNHMMGMGGLVERQVANAIEAICSGDTRVADDVIRREDEVDKMEVNIDHECTQILVRRQPAASDLRMVLAVSRVVRDLERIGDEASKIAIHTLEVADNSSNQLCQQAMRYMGAEVVKMISGALDAFARHDVDGAIDVVRNDKLVDQQYASALRELITYMMEDPRSIGQAINILWILRAIERIGDHARNISEQVIYLVKGTDVRHSSLTEIEEQANKE
ncbi:MULTISPECIES: phosphate signaling complex protein PhoU [Oceanospirillaceae]|jgi:phosphate transport system protein|uniref:phosphate signaling complex protein PhoU n=1 Tax=Oceanospirillaceae TaxID=135620 RepID=UPI000C45F2BD|nr:MULTISPECIES: phosphate signaling complex protein PhoU [Thalassolituus]MAY13720.1 phosphate transport system regulatory protein PhoU [Oceanospirillaceae bacterium]MBU2037842.1 phosphate signaling complex protein PhoU [Gammaproteobacteria bacterium]PIQ39934.1 MAG: phosphate transport system regulatory protein PhoU [Thalassolituus sp. CG17_big_fil_post_rev_8_21_14_2_50_53_8]MCA6058917.1 phosphate signaling complex protein PhoU [Thalassolituus sp. ST750PaO-4]MCB2387780.1 phosphate signaling co|tara:strand:+ start:147 stop:860 length:714 start_codon:yes stop_codon:yes gene_type:complete